MTQWQPGMRITAGRLMDGADPLVVTDGIVPASGWTVNNFSAQRSGRVVTLFMNMHRSGATLTVSAGGNLGDTEICTVPAEWAPTQGELNGNWDDGYVSGGFTIDLSGVCTLRTSTGDIVGDATDPGDGRNPRLHIAFIRNV